MKRGLVSTIEAVVLIAAVASSQGCVSRVEMTPHHMRFECQVVEGLGGAAVDGAEVVRLAEADTEVTVEPDARFAVERRWASGTSSSLAFPCSMAFSGELPVRLKVSAPGYQERHVRLICNEEGIGACADLTLDSLTPALDNSKSWEIVARETQIGTCRLELAKQRVQSMGPRRRTAPSAESRPNSRAPTPTGESHPEHRHRSDPGDDGA